MGKISKFDDWLLKKCVSSLICYDSYQTYYKADIFFPLKIRHNDVYVRKDRQEGL